jgi:hypothetical protein
LRADDVTAVDDSLGPLPLRLLHGLRQGIRTIVAVRNDANLHGRMLLHRFATCIAKQHSRDSIAQ